MIENKNETSRNLEKALQALEQAKHVLFDSWFSSPGFKVCKSYLNLSFSYPIQNALDIVLSAFLSICLLILLPAFHDSKYLILFS